jgi:hypothetical protein
MYELKKKIGKVFTSEFVRTGPPSYEKCIYQAAVSQRLRNTVVNVFSVMAAYATVALKTSVTTRTLELEM